MKKEKYDILSPDMIPIETNGGYKNKPRKSNKFGTMSLYYDGIYYFPSDIKKSDKREGKPFEIQGVYYSGKWYQDTFYITNEFKEFLLNAI